MDTVYLHNLTVALLNIFGSEWELGEPDTRHENSIIRKAYGLGLHISNAWKPRGRIQISGTTILEPKVELDNSRKGDLTTITVDPSRSPESIANDIQRRLMPEWEVNYQKILASIADAEHREEQAELIAHRLIAASDGRLYQANWTDKLLMQGSFGEHTDIEVTPSSNGEQTLLLKYLAPDLAEQVVALVTNYYTQHSGLVQ